MNTVVLCKLANGTFATAQAGTFDSIDSEEAEALRLETGEDLSRRAPLQTILHESWTPEERAEFGIYVLEIDPPEGETWTGLVDDDNGSPVLIYEPVVITAAQVVQERTRRLAGGFDYDFQDGRGIHRIGTTSQDMAGWNEVTQWANAMQGLGQTEATLTAVTDTGPVTITPADWHAIIAAAHAFRQPIWQASFVLQQMQPIPLDYRDDGYWE
jgi:hypothetical protein